MTAQLLHLPGTAPPERAGLNLGADEVKDASGGYLRAADQLRALHARGFVRAWRTENGKGPVILERSHYEAVTRGEFMHAANDAPKPRPPARPDRAGFMARFGKMGA